MASLEELRPKIEVVLDDAVVDDRDAPRAVEMRMRVGCVRRRRELPSGCDRCPWLRWDRPGQTVDAANILVDHEIVRRRESQTPRVVAPVFKRFQRGKNCSADVGLLADVAENAAHAGSLACRHAGKTHRESAA